MNTQNETDNSSPHSQRKNGRDAVASNKSCKRNVGQTVENTANNSTRISNQRIDWDRNSLQHGSSRTFVEKTSNSETKDSNEGNEPRAINITSALEQIGIINLPNHFSF